MKMWYKILFRVIAFGLIVCIGLAYLSKVFFTYGEAYTEVRGFYEEPENSLDVLFVGSSSCVRAVSPMKMWDEYGFSSYSRATSLQSPVVTYEILKDALKYQSPKVVVLFCEWLWREYDYAEQEGQVRPVVDGMKMSQEKFELINYVCSKDSRQTRLSYLFPFFRYHERWSELELNDFKVDFMPISSYNKGQLIKYTKAAPMDETSPAEYRLEDSGESVDFVTESLEYYQKTIDLCKENDIEVVIVKGCKQAGWSDKYSWMLQKFAEQNNCAFLDYNYKDFIGDLTIEYPTDYCDAGHLNYYGSLKFSTHLGRFLKETYELPDKRENKDYQKWNEDLENYYIQNLRADIVLNDNEIQCHIIGYDDVNNLNLVFQYVLYKNGERIVRTENMPQDEYTFEISEPGTYKVQVYVYDDEIMKSKFNAFSEIEVFL